MRLEPVRRNEAPRYPHREERRRALRLLAIGGASLAAGGLLGCDTLRDVLGLSRPPPHTVGKMPAVHPPVQPAVQPTAPPDSVEEETPPAGDTDTNPELDSGKDPTTAPDVVLSAHPDANVAGGLRAPRPQPEPVPTDED